LRRRRVRLSPPLPSPPPRIPLPAAASWRAGRGGSRYQVRTRAHTRTRMRMRFACATEGVFRACFCAPLRRARRDIHRAIPRARETVRPPPARGAAEHLCVAAAPPHDTPPRLSALTHAFAH
jgi:hypothetical protein